MRDQLLRLESTAWNLVHYVVLECIRMSSVFEKEVQSFVNLLDIDAFFVCFVLE